MPGAARLLADLAAVLGTLGLRWYVFGAQCASAYGRPRMTADVDVTVDPASIDTLTLVDQVRGAGFHLRMDLGDDFLREARLLPLVHRLTSMPLDVVLASTDLQREFLDRARLVDAGGIQVPMMSPEDLVVTKVLAGRPKDLDDVRGVLHEQPSLDVERVRALLGQLEAKLEEPRLVARFERLLKSSRRADAVPVQSRKKAR
jgi:predicted nucleotidyltransferase